jgi:hypothetical protein
MWSSNSGSLITSVLYQVHATPVVRPVSVTKANTILEQGGDPKKEKKQNPCKSNLLQREGILEAGSLHNLKVEKFMSANKQAQQHNNHNRIHNWKVFFFCTPCKIPDPQCDNHGHL